MRNVWWLLLLFLLVSCGPQKDVVGDGTPNTSIPTDPLVGDWIFNQTQPGGGWWDFRVTFFPNTSLMENFTIYTQNRVFVDDVEEEPVITHRSFYRWCDSYEILTNGTPTEVGDKTVWVYDGIGVPVGMRVIRQHCDITAEERTLPVSAGLNVTPKRQGVRPFQYWESQDVLTLQDLNYSRLS